MRKKFVVECTKCHKRFSREGREHKRACKNISERYKIDSYLCSTCLRSIFGHKKISSDNPNWVDECRVRSKNAWKSGKIKPRGPFTEEEKEKLSRSIRRKFAEDDEYVRKISEARKRYWHDEGYREKQRAARNKREYREKMVIARINQPRISGIQKLLYRMLDDIGVKYVSEHRIGFYSFDCFVPSCNLLIECNGDYWHHLPRHIKNDKAKRSYIENNFPHLILRTIWEHEFKCSDRVICLLRRWLGIDNAIAQFNIKDVKIESITINEAKRLLEKFHYLMKVGVNSHCYGAIYEDKIIAVCCFGTPVRNETAIRLGHTTKSMRELSRFCIHPTYQKKNFASWFLSKCIKRLKEDRPSTECIVTFADTTYGHDGTIYKASNFIFDGIVKPSYWYVDKDGFVMHKKTLYNHAVKMNIKESEFARANGYKKVKGKEKLRFIFSY